MNGRARPAGFTAVMAQRAPTLDGLDYFPTPPWAARAGAAIIKDLDPEARSVWEPACGGGHMAFALGDYFDQVHVSDIFPHGDHAVGDFLDPDGFPDVEADWIVTNPPFRLGEAFVRQAWSRARRGVAMLLRLAFLEGAARHRLLYEDCPLDICSPFAERVPMVSGRWDPAASSATAYAWFFWLKPKTGLSAINGPLLRGINPGTKAKLSRPDDALRFGVAGATPLFEDAAG